MAFLRETKHTKGTENATSSNQVGSFNALTTLSRISQEYFIDFAGSQSLIATKEGTGCASIPSNTTGVAQPQGRNELGNWSNCRYEYMFRYAEPVAP
jgi:hypothetical protein